MDNDTKTSIFEAKVSTSDTNPRGAGRPRNPTDPESAYKSEILAWTALNRRIRELLEKQLGFFEKQLGAADKGGSTLSVESMLDVMKGLGDLMKVGRETVESGIKALEKGKTPGKDDEDPEAIMSTLQGGGAS